MKFLLKRYSMNSFFRKAVLSTCLGIGISGVFSPVKAQFYQGTQMNFGKNRVQYREFIWSFYRYPRYDVYFYVGGQNLAASGGKTIEASLDDIEQKLDYKIDGRIRFLVYNRLSDLKQSNVGLTDGDPGAVAGVTKISGNKVLLYNSGSSIDFERQIRSGVTQLLINQMMYGGSVRERIQNAAVLSIPPWFNDGLVSYMAVNWNTTLDDRMRDGILNGRFRKVNRLTNDDATVVGHSIWNYIAHTYGPSSIPSILYMTRSSRSVESGFLFVLGVSYKTLITNWFDYYEKKYNDADNDKPIVNSYVVTKRTKKYCKYSQLRVSPDGKMASYVSNELGRYKVYIVDLEKDKRRCIQRGGYRSISDKMDESFPLLAWSPKGNTLGVIYEKKGQIWIDLYDGDKKKHARSTILPFEKIVDFSFADNGEMLAVSAVQRGLTDVFTFNLRTRRFEQITRDAYDDVNPHFINNTTAIIFSSNRVSDTLYVEKSAKPGPHHDLFIYDYVKKGFVLTRVTKTPEFDEVQPVPYDNETIGFLSDENGIYNRYVAYLDTTIVSVDTTIEYKFIIKTFPQTNYPRNIINHDIDAKKKNYVDLVFHNGRYVLYTDKLPVADRTKFRLLNTSYRTETLDKKEEKLSDSWNARKTRDGEPAQPGDTTQNEAKVDINNYVFQSEIFRPKKKKVNVPEAKTLSSLSTTPPDSALYTPYIQPDKRDFLPPQRIYEVNFLPDYLVTELNNLLVSPQYQLFTGGSAYDTPNLGGLIKLGTSDLLEDYRIVGGFRLPFNLNNTEYFLSYDDLKYRLDKQAVFHRVTNLYSIDNIYALRLTSYDLRYSVKWPFSEVSAVRGTSTLRTDRASILATDYSSLQYESFNQYFGNLKLEYIYDNTYTPGINLQVGTRAKVWFEWYKRLDEDKTNTYIVGGDIRHYERVFRDMVWATRLAASTSFGDQQLIYYLGSIDNPVVYRSNGRSAATFNDQTAIDYSRNYVFQALATNLRGFPQNVRNGNSFAVVNTELRFPLFKFIMNRPIKSDFFRNFQIVGFADAGTAWSNGSPFSDNTYNNRTITNGPFVINLTTQESPILAGYGFGLRSRLLGYFIRADWAWGVLNGLVQPQTFYLSLNLDF